MARSHWLSCLIVALASGASVGCNDDAIDIQGAGATFPAPAPGCAWYAGFYRHSQYDWSCCEPGHAIRDGADAGEPVAAAVRITRQEWRR